MKMLERADSYYCKTDRGTFDVYHSGGEEYEFCFSDEDVAKDMVFMLNKARQERIESVVCTQPTSEKDFDLDLNLGTQTPLVKLRLALNNVRAKLAKAKERIAELERKKVNLVLEVGKFASAGWSAELYEDLRTDTKYMFSSSNSDLVYQSGTQPNRHDAVQMAMEWAGKNRPGAKIEESERSAQES